MGNSLLFSAVGFGHTGDSYTLAGCIGTCLTGVPGPAMVHPPTSPCDIFGTLQLPTVWLCPFPDVHYTSCYSVLLFPTPSFFALFAFLKKSMNHHLEVPLPFGLLRPCASLRSWSNTAAIITSRLPLLFNQQPID